MKEDLNEGEAKEKEFLDTLINKYKSDSITIGSMYLLPDGTLLDLGNSGHGHKDICDEIIAAGFEENKDSSKGSDLLRDKGWLRINTNLNFIDLTKIKNLTEKQYIKLKGIINFMLFK